MTNAVLGAGSQLKLGDGASPQVLTLIAEVLTSGNPHNISICRKVTVKVD